MKYTTCLVLLVFFCCTTIYVQAQKEDTRLRKKLEESALGFRGDMGIYIKNLRTGAVIQINADTIFPTASIVKVPILIGVMDKIQRGELHYDSSLVYRDSLYYPGVDILGAFKDGETIFLKKIIMLMLTTSDNTASLWLQKLSGTGIRINEIMDSLGLHNTRVNSRTPGREANRTQYGWGQTTPADMGRLFELIYRSQLFSPAACDRMMRVLGRNYWDQAEAISQIPPTVQVFSKNGCINQARSEVLLVNAPHNPYIFCLFTKNNQDSSWTRDNEAWTLARKLSAQVYHYYEPADKWLAPQLYPTLAPGKQ